MKRLASIMLVMIIIVGLSITNVAAVPSNEHTTNWILSDNGNNIFVEIDQLPKITMISTRSYDDKFAVDEMELNEIIFSTDIASAEKYFQYFKSGGVIPELVINGVNGQKMPVFTITMENCKVFGYTITDSISNTDLGKTTIKLRVEKIAATKLNTPGAPLQVTPASKLNLAKVFINDIECIGPVSLGDIDGFCSILGSGSGKVYGSPEYSNFELRVIYSQIGTLPNWLASFDQKVDAAVSGNQQFKLRYEMSSTYSDDKLSFEMHLIPIGQALDPADAIYYRYTFRVFDFKFLTSPAAVSATADTTPAAPANLLKRGSDLNRVQDYTWAGKWVTTFGNMTLKQDGTKVTGEYGNPIETLEGTASGNNFTGTWHDSFSSGKFEFTMAVDGKSFKGTMYNQTLGDRGTFEWNGDRE